MSHNYLLETFSYIGRRVAEAQHRLTHADDNLQDRQFAAGQIEALCDFERFLMQNFNAKLPRRLRKHVPKGD